MAAVRAKDGRNRIFINKGLPSKNLTITGSLFIAFSNSSLYRKRDLGIRDNGRKKKRMGMPAGRAENTCNAKKDDLVSHPDFTEVRAIPDQRSSMSTGTGDLVKVKGVNDLIIKFLRNGVAEIGFNGYHNSKHGVSHVFGIGGRVQTLVGENPAFLINSANSL